MLMKNLDQISTLPLLAVQTLVMHDIHEADITSAWNLTGMIHPFIMHGAILLIFTDNSVTGISIRMALQLKLNHPTAQPSDPTLKNSETFLKDECSRRLMWSVFGADILLASDEMHVSDDAVSNLGLPCNLWNFTQGTPCTTLRLHDESNDAAAYHATNPNGYFIRILALRRRITK